LQRVKNMDEAKAEQTMKDMIAEGGIGLVYNQLFRYFDVLVVFMKGNPLKRKYTSVQRVVNQMHSGVPVLVEARGVFGTFVKEHEYPCHFYSDSDLAQLAAADAANATASAAPTKPRWTLEQALVEMKTNYELRQTCQRRGIEISNQFSPSMIGQAMLQALGYDTKQEGAVVC